MFNHGSPLPNISTSSSPENAIRGTQKLSPGICRKILVRSGFLLKNIGMPKKGRSKEFRESHSRSGDPERAFWDDFPWRMRTAKVDMLGMLFNHGASSKNSAKEGQKVEGSPWKQRISQ